MLAGVCGGLARYFEIHPAFFRVGFVVLTLLGGAGILIYLAAALVIPDEGKQDSVATAALRDRRDRPWPLIGLGLLAVAAAIAALAGDAVAARRRLVAVPDRGRRDPLDHAARSRADAAGGTRTRRTLAAADSHRVRRVLPLARDRRRRRRWRCSRSRSASSWRSSTCMSGAGSATKLRGHEPAGAAGRVPARDRHARRRPQRRAASRSA